MVRTDSHQLRAVAGDSPDGRGGQGGHPDAQDADLGADPARAAAAAPLREYFPAALAAFEDLDAADTLELLAKAPDPASAARLTPRRSARRSSGPVAATSPARRTAIQAALRTEHLGQPAVVTAAYAVTVRALVAVLTVLNEQIKPCKEQVEAHFGRHPDAEIYLSQPGLGHDPRRPGARPSSATTPPATPTPKARKNYAGTSPITRASGKKKVVLARYVHNDRLIDALRPRPSPR